MNTCFMTCFRPDNNETVSMLNSIGEELEKYQLKLVVLSCYQYHNLNITQIIIPFALGKYSEEYPNLVTDCKLSNFLIENLINIEKEWNDDFDFNDIEIEEGIYAVYKYCEILIDQFKPSLFLLWGSTLSQSIIFKNVLTIHGIPNFIIERGLLPDTLMLESIGHSAYSDVFMNFSISNTITKKNLESENRYVALKKYYLDKKTTKHKQKDYKNNEELKSSLKLNNKHIIVLFGQWEAASAISPVSTIKAKYSLPNFNSLKELVEFLSSNVSELKNSVIIFKPHPYDRNDYTKYMNENFIVSKEINVINLFEIGNVFVGISSTVLFEAMFYEKPIILLGKSQLSNKNCAYEPKFKKDIIPFFNKAINKDNFEEKLHNQKIFINWIAEFFLIKIHNDIPIKQDISSLARFLSRFAAFNEDTESIGINNKELNNALNKIIIDKYKFLEKTEILITNNKYSKAKKILNLLINQYPTFTEALNNLAVVEILENNEEEAVKILDRVLELEPNNYTATNNKQYLKK